MTGSGGFCLLCPYFLRILGLCPEISVLSKFNHPFSRFDSNRSLTIDLVGCKGTTFIPKNRIFATVFFGQKKKSPQGVPSGFRFKFREAYIHIRSKLNPSPDSGTLD